LASLTIYQYVENAQTYLDRLVGKGNTSYIWVGKPNPWLDDETPRSYNDAFIPITDLSVHQSEGSIYKDLMFGKLITNNDVSLMAPRYNWAPNTVFARYWNTDSNLYSNNFYVVTDTMEVYKCLDNNYGAPSFVKPIITSQEGVFFTGDGYIWKYMFTIPPDIDSKFSLASFIPVVSNAAVQANAVPGSVDVISMTSFGNNYQAFYSGFLESSVSSTIVGLDALASPYSNFYVGSSIYLKSGLGSGQLRKIVRYDGLSKLVEVDEPFDSYVIVDLSNVSGSFNVGDVVTQNIDNLGIYYYSGVFQVGDMVVQSDTGVTGEIVTANSTNFGVVKTSQTPFSLGYPIYNTSQSGTPKSGTVTCAPFTYLDTFSNTAAFTVGETIFQSNGVANVGLGTLFGVRALPNTALSFDPSSAISSNFIKLSTFYSPFKVGQQLVYTVASGNIPVFGLSNNQTYYVSYATLAGVKLANTFGGANLTLTTSKSETFNPNTGITGSPTNTFIQIANNWFSNNQLLTYKVSAGNTVLGELINGGIYYAVNANSSGLSLTTSYNGSAIPITPGTHSETGHTLTYYIPYQTGHSLTAAPSQLILAQVNGAFTNASQVKGATSSANGYVVFDTNTAASSGLAYAFSTNAAATAFVNNFSAATNTYVRIGSNTANNIRRVVAVNSTCLTLDIPLSGTVIANVYYSMPYAAEILSVTLTSTNGYITNTNLTSVEINYSNTSLPGTLFVLGEQVEMVNSQGIQQGIYGTVAYCNSSTVILSDIVGSFATNFFLDGSSSMQTAKISAVTSYPTITVSSTFAKSKVGQQIFSRSPLDLSMINGQANVVSVQMIPSLTTEYVISPTVTITGDGSGALAYSTVNSSPTVSFPLANVIVINSGTSYTWANVEITSNLSVGFGATAIAGVSPVHGHGSNSYVELGARYASITMEISNSSIENYVFPAFGSYRRLGILEKPLFNNIYAHISSYDRVVLSTNTVSANGWTHGEVVMQPNTLASGIVVFSNATYLELGNVKGTFSANGKYANGSSSNDNILGLFSSTTGNVAGVQTSLFFGGGIPVYEVNSGASATLVSVISSNTILLSNVSGSFDINDMLYCPTTNSYGIVNGIFIANGTIDIRDIFGESFNQTLRFPFTANASSFEMYEYVTQDITQATGQVVGGCAAIPSGVEAVVGNDVDIQFTGPSGSFVEGTPVTQGAASGIVLFANSTYLRLISVTGSFTAGQVITDQVGGATATINAVYPVILLNNINGEFSSGVLSGNLTGSNTGSYGRCDLNNVITYPDLVDSSGTVTYLENLSPFQLSNTTQEKVSVLIQF